MRAAVTLLTRSLACNINHLATMQRPLAGGAFLPWPRVVIFCFTPREFLRVAKRDGSALPIQTVLRVTRRPHATALPPIILVSGREDMQQKHRLENTGVLVLTR